MDQEGPNAMALEMVKWLVAWGRRYDAEWDGMHDILQCLWNLSRSHYTDNRSHGVVPIVLAAVTLARDVEDEAPIPGMRLVKLIGEFYSPPGTVPKPLLEVFGSWTTHQLETWLDGASRCVPVARRWRRGAQLTNSWGIDFMFSSLSAYLEDAHLIGHASLTRRTRMNNAISDAMTALATQNADDIETARRSLTFESP